MQKYTVAFVLLVYEKPKNDARETSDKTISTGYVIMPKVPTIYLPNGKTLCKQEKINAKQKTIKQIALNTFFLVRLTLLVVSKINSYSSICANKSS